MFTIVTTKGNEVIEMIPWLGMLGPAKIRALDCIRANGADKVVVLDQNDRVLFTHHRNGYGNRTRI